MHNHGSSLHDQSVKECIPPSPTSPPPPSSLFQDLIPVKFTPVADGYSKAAAIVKEARYMCPVTRDTLSNSVPSCTAQTKVYLCRHAWVDQKCRLD